MLRALGLGDLLTAVPALRALRRSLQGDRLVLAAPEPLRPLVRLSGCVDEMLPSGELEPVGWSGAPPDVAVNLHGRGPQSHRLLQRLDPRRLVAFANDEAGVTGPKWRDDEHERVRWCRLVQVSLGGAVDPDDVRIAAPAADAGLAGAVVLHPGAAYPARRWPADRFAAVGRWAAARGLPVVVTGGPAEVEVAREVQQRAGLPSSVLLAGRTDLEQLASVVSGAALVVCGDTGVAHLASAYGTPSVLLFGPVPPEHWGPPPGPHVVLWHGRTGDPLGPRPDPGLLDITVEQVLAQVEVSLAAPRTTAASS